MANCGHKWLSWLLLPQQGQGQRRRSSLARASTQSSRPGGEPELTCQAGQIPTELWGLPQGGHTGL